MPFITPSSTPTETVRRCLCIPNDLLWLAAVSGALQVLTHAYNWEDIDGITAEQAAQDALEMLQSFYEGECNVIGEIRAFVSIAAMPIWVLPMDGTTYAQADYAALADVIPSSWKSGTNFTLPDLINKTLIGNDFANPTSAPLEGSTGGAATHALTVTEMPSHNHTTVSKAAFFTNKSGATTFDVGSGATNIGSESVTDNTGAGSAHNNMPPYLVVAYGIIAQ